MLLIIIKSFRLVKYQIQDSSLGKQEKNNHAYRRKSAVKYLYEFIYRVHNIVVLKNNKGYLDKYSVVKHKGKLYYPQCIYYHKGN